MDPAEHQLMIEMLKQQAVAFAALVEILRNRGIVHDGDLDAYTELLSLSGKQTLVEDRVGEAYREFATFFGVELGDIPEAD